MSITNDLQKIKSLDSTNISDNVNECSVSIYQDNEQINSISPSSISPSSIYDVINYTDKSKILNVVSDVMVYTINGLYKVCDLIDKEVEIWSGSRWFRVFIYKSTQINHQNNIQKITICNGSCLKCTNNQNWAIIDKNKIISVQTNNLEIDMRIPTYKLPDILTGNIVKNAYDIGKQIGKLFISKQHFTSNKHIQLPNQIYTLCPHSLGRFVAGWMDSQNSNIYGNYNVIHDLQLLLPRLHIYISYIVKKNMYFMLEIPNKNNIPNPNNKIRNSNPHIKNNRIYINSIEIIPLVQKIYTIQNLDLKTKTIVLDGILAII